jgi:soluble lytic murein transglycosylase-like protein
MQHLQALIAQVEQGPAGFAAALQAAQASPAAGQSANANSSASTYTGFGASSTGAYPQIGQSPGLPTTAYASYSSGAPATLDSAGTAAGDTTAAGGEYTPLIEQAAARNGVDPAVLHGLIEQESGFDPSATSSAGALGLTQLMPSTAASLGVSEPLNPAESIEGGARYLGELLRQFGGNTTDALAAYNAGPGAVQQYGGVPPYTETQQYVSKVLANAAAFRQSTGTTASPAGVSSNSVTPGALS